MDIKGFPALIVGVVVALVLFGASLPVFLQTSDEYRTIYNNTSNNMAVVVDEDYNIVIDSMTVTINGEDVTPGRNSAIIMSETYNLLYQYGDNEIELYSNQHTSYVVLSGVVNITISGKDSTIEYGAEGSRVTEEYVNEWAYIMSADGEYGLYRLYNQSTTLYVSDISDVRGSNVLTTTSDWFSYVGDDVTLKSGAELTADYTLTPVSGMDGVYTISVGSRGTGYEFEVDNSGSPYTVHPWIVIVPLSVTGTVSGSSIVLTLIDLLPLLIGAGLAVGAVTWFFVSRKG